MPFFRSKTREEALEARKRIGPHPTVRVARRGDLALNMKADLLSSLTASLVRRIGTQRYELWFARNTRMDIEGHKLRVGVPNRFFLEWLEATYTSALREALAEVAGQPGSVEFVIEPQLFQANRQAQQRVAAESGPGAVASPTRPAAGPEPAEPTSSRRTYFHLRDFVVGPSNRLAHAAAMNLIESPDSATHPLTIYGQPGVGKTHLLEGIFSELRQRRGERAGVFVTAEEFTNRFLPAMQSRQLGPFRKHFREAAALFVDDLHFLSGKEATQREFLHTFEALRKLGRIVAVTCCCHPRQLPHFLPELIDRLQGGGAWPIELPDEQTRRALLAAKSAALGLSLPAEVLDFLGLHLRGNVRELEGALHTIRHYSRVHRRGVDLDLVRAALGPLLPSSAKVVDLQEVLQIVCQLVRLDPGVLRGSSRARRHAYPRMLAMYLARRCTPASYAEIGAFFGGRSHSTVIAAERKVSRCIAAQQIFPWADGSTTWAKVVEQLESRLRQP
jgi:chromosomal replication initiator protein